VCLCVVRAHEQVAAFLLAIKGIENVASKVQQNTGRPLNISDIFTNPIFRNIVLSILATLGLYVLSSLIFVRFFFPLRVQIRKGRY
jgi:chitin synthase